MRNRAFLYGAATALDLAGAGKPRAARRARPAWDVVADRFRRSLEGSESLSRALAEVDDYKRAKVLARIAPEISVDLVTYAFSITGSFRDPYLRVEIWIALIPYLPEEIVSTSYDSLFSDLQKIVDPKLRAQALADSAEHIPESLMPRVLAMIRGFEYLPVRVQATATLADRFGEPERTERLKEALTIARETKVDAETRVAALEMVLPFTEGDQEDKVVQDLLDTIFSISEPEIQLRLLRGVITKLPTTALATATAAIRKAQETKKVQRRLPGSSPEDKPEASHGS